MNHSFVVPQPAVSIIVPVFNAKKYLLECIGSLTGQTLQNIEIICIDDGSSDSSFDILTELSSRDTRIVVLKNETNIGQACTRNKGLSIARGDYVGFVDSDDFVSLNFFESLYNVAVREDADVAASPHVDRVPVNQVKGMGLKGNIITHIKDRARIIEFSGVCANKIYRRSFLEKERIRFPDFRTYGEDNLFTFLSIKLSNRIAVSHAATYYYRFNENSIVNGKKDSSCLKLVDTYKLIEDRLSSTNNDEGFWQGVLKRRARTDCNGLLLSIGSNSLRQQFIDRAKELLPDISLLPVYPEAIISLTSYPARIQTVAETIRSLLNQDIPSKGVVLWLAESQFPNKEADLPSSLTELRNNGLIIKWCEDWKSYKKLIPALEEFPTDLIVTADDDVIYPRDWLRRLVRSYVDDPSSIHCLRAHRVTFKHGRIAKYMKWDFNVSRSKPSFFVFGTGVGGIIYKRELLHEDILRKDLFMKICPNTDDIWFWAMAVLRGTKINVATPTLTKPQYIDGTQDDDIPLYKINMATGNDESILRLVENYPRVNVLLKNEKYQDWLRNCLFRIDKDDRKKKIKICGMTVYKRLRIGNKKKHYIFGLRVR